MNRRLFLTDLTKLATLAATTPNLWRLRWRPTFASDPFLLGVACGDPTPDGAVLWTRLAPKPFEPDWGLAGARAVVRWEVAEDERFSRVVKKGDATATPELAHSVHVNVSGLRADRWYYYRFTSGDAMSDVGRLRTTPEDSAESPLKFAFVSCNHYEQGHFTAFKHLAEEDVDLIAHLGDYVYERAGSDNQPRRHVGGMLRTLEDYRNRYAQYKTDEHLRAAHARCSWTVIWDDHEVRNNYSMFDHDSLAGSAENQRDWRAAGYQGWWEHQPVRLAVPKAWDSLKIYRTTNWGRLARFWEIDDRQYRWDQACGDGSKAIPCGDWDDAKRAMLGDAQDKWLVDGLQKSRTRWQVLANQVVFSPPDEQPKAGDRVDMDKWSGYPVDRDRLLAAIGDHAPNRTVVLTGDIHSSWVYDVRRGFDKTDRPVIAAEFVGTSISSDGDGTDNIARITDAYLTAHPSLKWANGRRGYVRCSVSGDEWKADYRTVPFVKQPGAPIVTASSWRVARGRPGVERL